MPAGTTFGADTVFVCIWKCECTHACVRLCVCSCLCLHEQTVIESTRVLAAGSSVFSWAFDQIALRIIFLRIPNLETNDFRCVWSWKEFQRAKKEQMIKESEQRGAFVPLWQQNIKKYINVQLHITFGLITKLDSLGSSWNSQSPVQFNVSSCDCAYNHVLLEWRESLQEVNHSNASVKTDPRAEEWTESFGIHSILGSFH